MPEEVTELVGYSDRPRARARVCVRVCVLLYQLDGSASHGVVTKRAWEKRLAQMGVGSRRGGYSEHGNDNGQHS